jgi:uncharacterized protein YyaL (SSP411 family)
MNLKKSHNSNRLSKEISPYLLQHANNPVNWYPWGDEAFKKAKREDKPIFLSIGYSTCHWCHVMAHESFEDIEVANLLNKHFVCIKVDREERPDIDNVYMTICQMMTGTGGWPLTIIMTPDKEPFFSATYIPKNNKFRRAGLVEIIPNIVDIWHNKKSDIENLTNQIKNALNKSIKNKPGENIDKAVFNKAFNQLEVSFDNVYGGIGNAPKFPTPHNLMFLMRIFNHSKNQNILKFVKKTLISMRKGGIYDHIGFGFHRYSTDRKWIVPHFEKMLYDQAMLALAYIEAFQITGSKIFKKTSIEILEYVSRVLTSPEGAFYSAEDADSNGIEGKFYLWKYEELSKFLSKDELDIFSKTFNILKDGNFFDETKGVKSDQNILHLSEIDDDKIYSEKENVINSVRKKIFIEREKRNHPEKDDKILTDWNGLMIKAFSKASQAFNDEKYEKMAEKAADFIINKLRKKDGGLYHVYRKGAIAIDANIDDYAFFIDSLIELFQTNFKVKYLQNAIDLQEYLTNHFWDEKDGGFYFVSDENNDLLVRKKELYDSAIPSGNSIALLNLVRLSKITGEIKYESFAKKLIGIFSKDINKLPKAYTQFLIALDLLINPSFEIVVAGNKEKSLKTLKEINKNFIPNKVQLLRLTDMKSDQILYISNFLNEYKEINGKPAIYICRNYSCQKPLTNVNEAINKLIKN